MMLVGRIAVLLAGVAFATLGVLHLLDPAFLASDLPYPRRAEVLPHALSLFVLASALFAAALRLARSSPVRFVVAAVLLAVPLVQASLSFSDSPPLALIVLAFWGLPALVAGFILFAERAA